MTLRLVLSLALLSMPVYASAQEAVTGATPAAEESSSFGSFDEASSFESPAEKKTLSWSGFVEPDARILYGEPNGKWIDSSTPKARLELKVFPTDNADGAIVGELNAAYAATATPAVTPDLREAWVRFAEGPLSVSLGKQIYNWSSIIEFGVTDVLNPQELPDLAQDAANRKLGLWSLRSVWDAGFMQVEAYAMPWFEPNALPLDGPFLASSGRMRALQRAAEADGMKTYGKLVGASAEIAKQETALKSDQRALDEAAKELEDGQAGLEAQVTSLEQQVAAATTDAERAQLYSQLAQAQAGLASLAEQRVALGEQNRDLAARRTQVAAARQAHDERMNTFQSATQAALSRPVKRMPPRDLRGTEGAVRLYFPLDLGDFSLGVARLHDRVGTLTYVPAPGTGGQPSLVMTFPKLTAWTLTGAVPVSSFVFRFEGLYLHTADRKGVQPYVRNPTVQSAAQVQWDPASEWQVRVGVQDERILKIDGGEERKDEYSIPSPAGSVLLLLAPRIAHAAVTYRFGDAMHQLTGAYLFSYESNGHFVQPEADLVVTEGLRWKAGAQIFLGDAAPDSFGQLEELSNVYTSMRVSF